jgi:tRNA A-37 threonylcarbamoyl transferase component Bud32
LDALAQLVEQMQLMRAEAAARDVALRAELAMLRAEMAALRREGRLEESPSAPSYATVGDEALVALTLSGRISAAAEPAEDAAGDAELAPIATPAELAHLCACASEREFVAAITPLMRGARGLDGAGAAADPCARVLVNSESVAWLDALHKALPTKQLKRPDLFATWAPFWSGHADAARGAVGRLAHRALQLDGCVCEFYEAKRGDGELTAADFGQLVDYHSRVRGRVRGVLFNARFFWLYESYTQIPVALIKGELGARGSRAALRAFFDAAPEPPLVPLLRHLCRELRVAPRHVTAVGAERTSAFLGAGGSARVFCVAAEGGAPAPLALKVSEKLSRTALEYEFSTLQRAADAGAPVVPVVPDSLVVYVDDRGTHRGGGFLLRDVCARAVLETPSRCAAAFAALRALHAAGFAHGDARLPNLVVRGCGAGAELLWIDLREADEGELAAAQHADARALAASALGVTQDDALPARVEAVLDSVPAGGEAAYDALAAAVWKAFAA